MEANLSPVSSVAPPLKRPMLGYAGWGLFALSIVALWWLHPYVPLAPALVSWLAMGAAGVAGTVMCWMLAWRGAASRWQQLGWGLLTAALLVRAAGPVLAAKAGAAGAAPSMALLLTAALWLHPLLLCAGVVCRTWTKSSKSRLALLDGAILGGCVAALGWWLYAEPLVAQARPAASKGVWVHLLGAALLCLAGGILVLSRRHTARAIWSERGRSLLLAGVALLAVADFRFFSLLRAQPASFDAILRVFGPLCIAAALICQEVLGRRAALSQAAPSQAAPSQAAPSEQGDDLEADDSPASRWGGLWSLAAAGILVAVAAWYSGARGVAAPGEAWWAPLVLLLAIGRHLAASSLNVRREQGTIKIEDPTFRLQQEAAASAQQLSILHAVAADLHKDLTCEQVLNTALKRAVEAVRADAGAVWLRLEFDEAAILSFADGGKNAPGQAMGTLSSATFLRRELERDQAERQAVESLRGKATAPVPSGEQERRWRRAAMQGEPDAGVRAALKVLHETLEANRCDIEAPIDLEVAGFQSAALALIHWKGEVMGAVGLLRREGAFNEDERALLQSILLEVGAGLQNAYLRQEANRLADRDGVTDLLNHRAVQQQLNAGLARARRAKTDFVVIMMDLDNFKFFNDTYGHDAGDSVLRTVAACLQDACRVSDVLGRYGGDEFVSLLFDTDLPGARHVCSRIVARLEEEGFQDGQGRRIPIKLSFGAAIYPQDAENALELLHIAADNLYEAKNGGTTLLLHHDGSEENQELRRLKDVDVGGSFGVLDALVTAIDNKDHYTRRHSEDVTHWAACMARELGFAPEAERAVRICGLLHDVGKIAVPDAVLRKPGRLSDEEFNIMQQHPVFGALIVKDVPNLPEVIGGIRHHHERFDGKGYPDKLSGDDIPLFGRLLAVPDCFSAMTTDRPYRKALSWAEAVAEIEKGKGTQFDPVMADAFLEAVAKSIALDATPPPADVAPPEHDILPRSVVDAATA